ncbi:MAG: hypothetical protein ACPGPE_14265, partial [Planctomycetota bacterium]
GDGAAGDDGIAQERGGGEDAEVGPLVLARMGDQGDEGGVVRDSCYDSVLSHVGETRSELVLRGLDASLVEPHAIADRPCLSLTAIVAPPALYNERVSSVLAEIVRACQHLAMLFTVGLPLLVVLPTGWRWTRSFRLRLVHLALLTYLGINALLGRPSLLTVLEWELRDAGAGVTSSYFDGPNSDLIFLATRFELSASQLSAIVFAAIAFTLLTFAIVPPRDRSTAS